MLGGLGAGLGWTRPAFSYQLCGGVNRSTLLHLNVPVVEMLDGKEELFSHSYVIKSGVGWVFAAVLEARLDELAGL